MCCTMPKMVTLSLHCVDMRYWVYADGSFGCLDNGSNSLARASMFGYTGADDAETFERDHAIYNVIKPVLPIMVVVPIRICKS